MTTLKIIVASTRPGSSGPAIAGWIAGAARRGTDFDSVEVLDLAEINLPFLDEPHHPKLGRYTKPHTLAWAREIDTADALVIVTPEYNSGFPAPLKNAIDFLHAEWHNKAAGFVSYGSNGGVRAVEHLRLVLGELQVADVQAQVALSVFTDFEHFTAFKPGEHHEATLNTMLAQVVAWGEALAPLRT